MTMLVQASTADAPELADLVERRRAQGLDRFDEWWEGVYRIVTGPAFEHGELLVRLAVLLDAKVTARGLTMAAPVNIGVDGEDARVPDLAVVRPGTERTSPAFLATAELVVEILSPRERAGEKLPFYARWNVTEYLEIDRVARTCRLLTRDGTGWRPIDRSAVVDLDLDEVQALL